MGNKRRDNEDERYEQNLFNGCVHLRKHTQCQRRSTKASPKTGGAAGGGQGGGN
jgi:hypothetical protein